MTLSAESQLSGRSPWALNAVRLAKIAPLAGPVDAQVRVPGSKSYTNRALILAAVAHGPSVLRGILRSDDSYWCIEALKALGIAVQVEDDVVHLQGCGGQWPVQQGSLFIGSAGTTARFLPGLLAASATGSWTVDGSTQLRGRPLQTLLQALDALGANLQSAGAGTLPLHIVARGLQGGEVTLPGTLSSQFFSGLLMAAPYARGPVTVRAADSIVQDAYILMTLDTMQRFGVQVIHDTPLTCMQVQPQRYHGGDLPLEADASTAGYFFALAALSAGRVRVTNIDASTRQPDIGLLGVLEQMGCQVQRGAGWVEVRGPAILRGNLRLNLRDMSDQTLTLAALAAFANGPVTLTDVAHVRHHESDRIAAACSSLRALGVRADEHPDGLTVHPGPLHGASLPTYDDHRVAMAMSLVGTRVPGVEIQDPGCVSKTCPTFYDALTRLGVGVQLTAA